MNEHTCKCGWQLRSNTPMAIKCGQCGRQVWIGKSRGLGDTIRKITTALHIPHCGGCEQRQQKLNEMFPYTRKDK